MTNKYYKYFNPNPKGLETGDCVIRALCAITGKSWYEIFDIIVKHARDNCVMPNENQKTIEYRMQLFGLKRYTIPKPKKGNKCYTVEQFCKEHTKGKYILKIAHHEMAVIDGQYYDIYPGWERSRVYSYYELIPAL